MAEINDRGEKRNRIEKRRSGRQEKRILKDGEVLGGDEKAKQTCGAVRGST